jgi:non-ribosomal peptide synthetase component E (peptide arylation enzyme)
MLSTKVLLGQLLYELGVVESGSGGCRLTALFESNVLGASTADIQARLFRLALGLVNYTSLKDAQGLHSSKPSEDL